MSDASDRIASQNAKFMEAFIRQDAADIAALYTDNGTLLPPGGDFLTGYHDIKTFWGEAMNLGVAAATLERVELEVFGETAIEVGKYTLTAKDSSTLDHGKFIVIWKKERNLWKLHRDMWNTSRSS
jgi:ketosteroid isomerase-like protein